MEGTRRSDEDGLVTLSKRARSTAPTLSALESTSCRRPRIDYRKTLLQVLLFSDAIAIQRFTGGQNGSSHRTVSDPLMSSITHGVFAAMGSDS
jgi:hypothetical protein